MRRAPQRRRPKRPLRRGADGGLIDAATGAPVGVTELAVDLADGRRFSVIDEATGHPCTYDVLGEVLRQRFSARTGLVSEMAEQIGAVTAALGRRRQQKGDEDG